MPEDIYFITSRFLYFFHLANFKWALKGEVVFSFYRFVSTESGKTFPPHNIAY
jgi:hypothetical protein